MDFKIGKKVICVGQFKANRMHKEAYPIKGMTYTIREIVVQSGIVGLLLEEIVNPARTYKEGFSECAFCIENFRPVQYQSATADILARFQLTEEKADVDIEKTKINLTEKKVNDN